MHPGTSRQDGHAPQQRPVRQVVRHLRSQSTRHQVILDVGQEKQNLPSTRRTCAVNHLTIGYALNAPVPVIRQLFVLSFAVTVIPLLATRAHGEETAGVRRTDAVAAGDDTAGITFFEKEVRPLLIKQLLCLSRRHESEGRIVARNGKRLEGRRRKWTGDRSRPAGRKLADRRDQLQNARNAAGRQRETHR